MFRELANLGALLRQARQLGGLVDEAQAKLRQRRATGSAGGGMVEIELNGLIEVLACRIDPQLSAQGDRELIEDLVVAAANQAIAKARQLHADLFREMAGGVDLPGLHEALARLGMWGASGEPGPPGTDRGGEPPASRTT